MCYLSQKLAPREFFFFPPGHKVHGSSSSAKGGGGGGGRGLIQYTASSPVYYPQEELQFRYGCLGI